jgi:hypothetical protein
MTYRFYFTPIVRVVNITQYPWQDRLLYGKVGHYRASQTTISSIIHWGKSQKTIIAMNPER